jgi:hypothetical protein
MNTNRVKLVSRINQDFAKYNARLETALGYRYKISCPNCGEHDLDLGDYFLVDYSSSSPQIIGTHVNVKGVARMLGIAT